MELTNEQQSLRRVVVTGAAGALGSKVLEHFVDAGCTVVGIDRNFAGNELVRHKELHRLHLLGCDLTHADAVQGAFEHIKSSLGGIDALIHCAGGFRFTPAHETITDDIDFLVDLNLKSSLIATREALKAMKTNGFGRIVLVSSASALKPGFGVSSYVASKAGLHAFIESVAAEVKDEDINIHAVAPGMIDTEANRREMPDADFSKWVSPNALAEIIFLLTQPTMNAVRQCVLPVTGGH
jgi:NAD(P)-dependent dehydrogenase (short-subunit alcohol dehydrogenase family)